MTFARSRIAKRGGSGRAERPAAHAESPTARVATRLRTLACAVLSGALCLLFVGPAVSSAQAAPAAWWHLSSGSRPTNLAPGSEAEIALSLENLGTAPVEAAKAPALIADTLPAGLTPLGIAATRSVPGGIPQALPCALATLTCQLSEALPPYDTIEVRVKVRVEPGAESGEINEVSVAGGAIPAAHLSRPIAVSGEPTPFGLEAYEFDPEEPGGAPVTHAASHPFQITTEIAIDQAPDPSPLTDPPHALPAVLAKDAITKLPPGQLADPTPFPTCSLAKFLTQDFETGQLNSCPAQTAIGVTAVSVFVPGGGDFRIFTAPLFNLEPAFGEPARFGFMPVVPVVLDTSLRSGPDEAPAPGAPGADYGADVAATNITQTAALTNATVTFWGTPGDPSHAGVRGWGCLEATLVGSGSCESLPEPHPPALLFMPTSCSGPLQTSVEADSWEQPGLFQTALPGQALPALGACNQVPFAPTAHAEPTSDAATSPTGFNFDLSVNDEGLTNPASRVQSQLRKAVVTLPQGFTTNPSVAAGLKACSEAAYEASTLEPASGCPSESKIGDVEVESPLVTQKLTGSLYVAQQHQNPFHNLLTLYMVFRNPELGVLVKAAGKVEANPVTGQLTTTFDDLPQLPFTHFRLSFRQGQRSPLITPPACGTYTVKADLYPWSNPTVPLEEESSFQITAGPEGQPCPSGGVPPFHPDLEAGTLNNAAGTYSPFYTHISRRDSEQEITHFSIKLPPGVIGKLAGVNECTDAQIAAAKAREREGGGAEEEQSPSCPAASQVGRTLVGSGVGGVLAYAPGKMYLAGPYHGSNLSLVSITAAKVGPFDLGTVVVRFALRINPETAEVFVDATGSDPIPHIVDGIPVHLRDIRAYVDRPEFTLNPTGCERTSTASTVLGSGLDFASEADDQPVTVTSPFQAADCASLGFKPKLALSLKGGTKRGATPAFKAVLSARPGDANIGAAQVTLPSSEYLEQAHIGTVCTRTQFAQGTVPGEKCPAASIYGFAKAVTPILSEPLQGPVYLRSSSHPLPDLVAALNNKQVNIDLDGHIDAVHKKGSEVSKIRNTFEAVPDAPVTQFTLEMQGGNKGLLVNSTNICRAKNHAIVAITGHNGKVEDFNPVLQAPCGGKGKKTKARH